MSGLLGAAARLLLLPLLVYLPGWALLGRCDPSFAAATSPGRGRGAGHLDRLFASLAVTSWTAVLTAELGIFSLPSLAASNAAAVLLFLAGPWWLPGRRSGFARSGLAGSPAAEPSGGLRSAVSPEALPAGPGSPLWSLAAALLLALLLAVAYRPPVVPLLGESADRAAAGHLRAGIQLARHSGLRYPDRLLPLLPPELREDLFRPPGGGDLRRFPGEERLLDPGAPCLAADLFPLLPSWIALLQLLGGPGAALGAPLLFAGLALLAAWRLAVELSGRRAFGLLLLAALGLNYIEIWHGKVFLPELAAQFLLLAAARFYGRSRDIPAGSATGGGMLVAAAFCLGSACLASPALALLLPLSLLLLLAGQALARSPDLDRSLGLGLGLLPFLAQALFHTLAFTSFGGRLRALAGELWPLLCAPGGFLARLLPAVPDAAGGVAAALRPAFLLLLAGLALLLPLRVLARRSPRRAALFFGLPAASLLAFHFLLFYASQLPHPGGTSRWLTGYLTFPVFLLLLAALAHGLFRPGAALLPLARRGPLLPLALLSAAHFLFQPFHPPLQPWASRRFVVAVLPAALLLALLFARHLGRSLRSPALRLLWAAAIGFCLGLYLFNALPLVLSAPGEGARTAVEQAAGSFSAASPRLLLVFEPGLAPLGLAASLNDLHGLDSLVLPGKPADRAAFGRLVASLAGEDRAIFLLVGTGGFTPDPRNVSLEDPLPLALSFRSLPALEGLLPSTVSDREVALLALRARPLPPTVEQAPALGGEAGAERLDVDVGDYQEDWPFLESGFQEIRVLGGTSFRWTGERATLRIPAGAREMTLRVGAFRPPALPPAWLRLGVGGEPTREEVLLPREGFLTLGLTLPPAPASGGRSVRVCLETDPFTPGPWLPEDDDRLLGVQVDHLSLFFGEWRGVSFH